jgi:hypothetical protein
VETSPLRKDRAMAERYELTRFVMGGDMTGLLNTVPVE